MGPVDSGIDPYEESSCEFTSGMERIWPTNARIVVRPIIGTGGIEGQSQSSCWIYISHTQNLFLERKTRGKTKQEENRRRKKSVYGSGSKATSQGVVYTENDILQLPGNLAMIQPSTRAIKSGTNVDSALCAKSADKDKSMLSRGKLAAPKKETPKMNHAVGWASVLRSCAKENTLALQSKERGIYE